MGLTKELFTALRDGIIDGLNIEREMRERMIDDEYRYTIYKKDKRKTKKLKNYGSKKTK